MRQNECGKCTAINAQAVEEKFLPPEAEVLWEVTERRLMLNNQREREKVCDGG